MCRSRISSCNQPKSSPATSPSAEITTPLSATYGPALRVLGISTSTIVKLMAGKLHGLKELYKGRINKNKNITSLVIVLLMHTANMKKISRTTRLYLLMSISCSYELGQ